MKRLMKFNWISSSMISRTISRAATPTSAGDTKRGAGCCDAAMVMTPYPDARARAFPRRCMPRLASSRRSLQICGDVAPERFAADDFGRARARQVDVDDPLHLAGTIGHHQDTVRHLHRFGDVVRDQQRRLLQLLLDLQHLVARAGAASARRARRRVRPSAGFSARRRACGRATRAAACRRTIRPG